MALRMSPLSWRQFAREPLRPRTRRKASDERPAAAGHASLNEQSGSTMRGQRQPNASESQGPWLLGSCLRMRLVSGLTAPRPRRERKRPAPIAVAGATTGARWRWEPPQRFSPREQQAELQVVGWPRNHPATTHIGLETEIPACSAQGPWILLCGALVMRIRRGLPAHRLQHRRSPVARARFGRLGPGTPSTPWAAAWATFGVPVLTPLAPWSQGNSFILRTLPSLRYRQDVM
mmetsp:Transcript_19453/g.44711  ORF Transcript_19453/g.44711 Transcript_19453/m.44711 type:complete len:233 (-) Transcript_19453:133-831(-)